jgi:lipocalin
MQTDTVVQKERRVPMIYQANLVNQQTHYMRCDKHECLYTETCEQCIEEQTTVISEDANSQN